jgi:hypothetical protein
MGSFFLIRDWSELQGTVFENVEAWVRCSLHDQFSRREAVFAGPHKTDNILRQLGIVL